MVLEMAVRTDGYVACQLKGFFLICGTARLARYLLRDSPSGGAVICPGYFGGPFHTINLCGSSAVSDAIAMGGHANESEMVARPRG